MSTVALSPAPADAAPVAPPAAARPTTYLQDVLTVVGRELRPLVREPFTLLFGMVQPLFFLALYGPLLVASDGLGGAASLQWFVPGILVMSVLFATSTTGANLLQELLTGSHERLLVTPLRRSTLLVGRALKEVVPVVGQVVLIVGVATPFGFEPHVASLLGLVLVAGFGVGLGALSYALALAVRDQQELFWVVQQTFLFPLMLLPGMLLPLDDAPSWLRVLSAANPLTYLVDAERDLFAGQVGTGVAGGLVATVVVATVGLAVGVRRIRATT
jgi:ABC-2 type transport system permease protein